MAMLDEQLTRGRQAPGGLFPYNDPRSKPGLYQTAGFGSPPAAAPTAAASLAAPRPPAAPMAKAAPKAPLMTTPGGVFPYNDPRGEKSLYGSVQMPAGLMPSARAVMSGAGGDAESAAKAGNYGVAAGHIARGAAALPVAIAHDVLDGPANLLEQAATPFVNGLASAGNTFATGESKPVTVVSPSTQAAPSEAASGGTAPTSNLGPVNPQTDVQRGGAAASLSVPNDPTIAAAPGVSRAGNSFGDSPEAAAAMLARPAGMSPQNQAAFDAIGDRANAESMARVQAAANKATYDQQVAEAKAINERETRLHGSKEAVAALNAMQANEQNQAKLGMEGQRVAIQGAQAQLAAAREARDAARGAIDLRAAQRMDALQSTILDPKSTPEAKQSASAALLLAQGKSPDDYQIVHAAGGQTTDPNTGLPIKQPDRLVRFSKRTGQFEEIAAAPTGQMPAVPADKAALVKGTTYQTARGPATWDGKQFMPVTGK